MLLRYGIVWVVLTILERCNYCDSYSISVLHLIDNEKWGEVDGSAIQGTYPCGGIKCNMISSDCKENQVACLRRKVQSQIHVDSTESIYVAMYNIHTWGVHSKWPHSPSDCLIPAHYTLAESEESHGRFHKLFKASFRNYDGNSTTSPFSSVQRTYFSGLNASEFLPLKSFSKLINGASFVASTCHKGEGTTKRVSVVMQLEAYIRVDSLGKCHTTRHIPEGIVLKSGRSEQQNLLYKQQAISHYMFYLAFENTYERGYVTEKVFDALIAGVVPVYLGPSIDCQPLLPHPNAAIFFDDFDHSVPRLAAFLQYLSQNETAYEEHRVWRHTFDTAAPPSAPASQSSSELFAKSWPCRICEWAHRTATVDTHLNDRREKLILNLNRNGTCS